MSDEEYTPEDLKPDDYDRIAQERQRFMKREFWISLIKGREGLGDTFWAGNYLAALIYLPVTILLLAIASFVPALSFLLSASFVVFGIYLLFVARAVAVARAKTNAGIGWRVAGVIWTLLNAGMLLAYAPFTGGA